MGHGHVTPNPDGSRTRCGGPAICKECALELARASTVNKKPSAKCYEGIKDRIYSIMFAKSRVDGVRVINEDEWPIEALADFVIGHSQTWSSYGGCATTNPSAIIDSTISPAAITDSGQK